MRLGLTLLFLLGYVTGAFADQYQFVVDSERAEDLVHIKNCFDYTTCLDTQTKFTKTTNGITRYRYELTAELTQAQLSNAVQQCGLQRLAPSLQITNITQNAAVPFEFEDAGNPVASLIPNVYLKNFAEDYNKNLATQVSQLITTNEKQKVIDLIISEFGLNTYGYKLMPSSEIGADYCITDHAAKTVKFGASFFTEPCELILAARHELEHVFQIQRSLECKLATGKTHNLDDHRNRERSAYLNDYFNAGTYCTDPSALASVRKNALYQLFDRYSDQPKEKQ